MVQDELSKRYFDWLYDLVCSNNEYSNLSYKKLLSFLYNKEFIYVIDLDENRAQDGIDFRYNFGYKNNYSDTIIKKYLDNSPCNILEMMIALSFRVEEQIMDDADYGNRTGQWFWNMIVSLGLGSMSDSSFDYNKVSIIVNKFLGRTYERNGKGGLFTIENCREDLREIEIWSQFMWYLDNEIG